MKELISTHHDTITDYLALVSVGLLGGAFGMGQLGVSIMSHVDCASINGATITPICSTLGFYSQFAEWLLISSVGLLVSAAVIQAYATNSGIFSSLDVASCNQQDVAEDQ
jgi:hypothetical protein